MATALQQQRELRAKFGIGMPGDNNHILNIARLLQVHVEAPVLGGIAVNLHGAVRTTCDLDFYTPDRAVTGKQMVAAGARWDASKREHVMEGVRIHTVTSTDAKHVVEKTSLIDGIRVVSLKDLVAIKLHCGLNNTGRSKDIGDVEALIRVIPLDKAFAGKRPTVLRASFMTIVDGVRANERLQRNKPRF